jgi:uncharacterized protein YkwD
MVDYLRDWYYLEPNWRGHPLVRGPFTLDQMRDFLKTNTISDKTQVRCGLESYWHPLREISGLFATTSKRKKSGRLWWERNQKAAVIVLVAVVALFFLIERNRTTLGSPPGSVTFPPREQLSKDAIITLTNGVRASQGLGALNENDLLNSIAQARAQDMLDKQYFAHVSPMGEQASDIARKVGYPYKVIAENIASGLFFTNSAVIDGWMQSPGHRRNILSSEVKEIGASIVQGKLKGENTWVSVQIFGLQSPPVHESTCIAPSPQLLQDIEIKKAEVTGLAERVTRLKEELDREYDAIELEKRIADRDPTRNRELSVRIRTYNEKSDWHNQSLAEMKAKRSVLTSMVDEYNRVLQAYRDCEISNRDHAG